MCGRARADFGPFPVRPSVTPLNSDGTVDTQAGSHPFSFNVHFEMKTEEGGQSEGGGLRDVKVDLPAGLLRQPAARHRAAPKANSTGNVPRCPGSTQLGVLRAVLPGVGEIEGPVYNLSPPPGVAFELGFKEEEFTVLQYVSVRSDEGYGLSVSVPDLPLAATVVNETIWGTPPDPAHDAERDMPARIQVINIPGCADTGVLQQPFLTLPTSCGSAPESTLMFDSTLNPGVFVSETTQLMDAGGNPAPLERLRRRPVLTHDHEHPDRLARRTAPVVLTSN